MEESEVVEDLNIHDGKYTTGVRKWLVDYNIRLL